MMLNTRHTAAVVWMVAVLAASGLIQAQAADATTASFALSDADTDGVIDVEEYRDRMIVILFTLDENQDGYLVAAEVPESHRDMVPVADTDSDGKIDLREYLVFVMPRFWRADYDGDNVLSLPEVIAADKREGDN